MRVRVEPESLPLPLPLLEKYRDPRGENVFSFHAMYVTPAYLLLIPTKKAPAPPLCNLHFFSAKCIFLPPSGIITTFAKTAASHEENHI
jgi:hypothetical protein